MGIITKMRKQDAVYWPPVKADGFGRPGVGGLVELILVPGTGNYRVRWEDTIEEFIDAQGTTRKSMAKVYVPQLPDGSEIVPGGYLWLGVRSALTLESEPLTNANVFEVKRVDKIPNLRATEKLRIAYL